MISSVQFSMQVILIYEKFSLITRGKQIKTTQKPFFTLRQAKIKKCDNSTLMRAGMSIINSLSFIEGNMAINMNITNVSFL